MWTEKHKLWIRKEDYPQNVELNLQNVDCDLENDGLIIEKFWELRFDAGLSRES